MENQILDTLLNWLVAGGGIMAAAQVIKNRVPLTLGGRVPSGAVWAAILSLAAAAGMHQVGGGAWEVGVILPVLSQGVVYWLTAYGLYDVVTAKGKQARDHAADALDEANAAANILRELYGTVTDRIDEIENPTAPRLHNIDEPAG